MTLTPFAAPTSPFAREKSTLHAATDREKKIAMHAKAKREAEKRRGTSE